MTKRITVIGATGQQGGSVAKTFLTDPKLKGEWKVRGITRDATKAEPKALEAKGAEIVEANINDINSLEKAFQGSDVVFAVTDYWSTMDKNKEVQQGKAMADVAKKVGVKQYIWSSLPNVTKISNGVLPNVYHFDSKAEVEEYVRRIGLDASFFMAGFYMTNFRNLQLLCPADDGTWTMTLATLRPTASFPMFAPEDTGKFVKGMLTHWEEARGRHILGATVYMTAEKVLATFKEVFPKAGAKAKFVYVPEDAYRKSLGDQGFPEYVTAEMTENFRLMGEFGYFGGESLDWTHSVIDDELTTWKDCVKSMWPELE